MVKHRASAVGSHAKTTRAPAPAAGGAASETKALAKPNSVLKSSIGPVTADARRLMIAETAYYIAEQRGFQPGHDVEDWLLAEAQVDHRLTAASSLAAMDRSASEMSTG